MSKYHKYNHFTSKRILLLRNCSKLLSRIMKPFKMILATRMLKGLCMLQELSRFLVKIIGGNLVRLSMLSSSNSMRSSMVVNKMLFFRILRGDSASSRGKCKILMINSERYCPFNGEWTVFFSTNFVQ